MSVEYVKTNWQDGDIITADKMNNIENGIKDVEETANGLKEDFTELKDIRVGADGTQYKNAGEAVRTQITNLKSELAHFLSLESDDAVIVPKNADFNDYTTPGNYRVRTIADSETISNIPYEMTGRLIVARTTLSDRIAQIYVCNSNVIFMYYRFYNGSTWGEWNKFLFIIY